MKHFISFVGTMLLLGQGWAVAAAELPAFSRTGPCLLKRVSDRSETSSHGVLVPSVGLPPRCVPSSRFPKPRQDFVWGRAREEPGELRGERRFGSPGAQGSSASVPVPPLRRWWGLRRPRRKRRPWFSTITTSPGPPLARAPCGSCAPHPGTRGECRGWGSVPPRCHSTSSRSRDSRDTISPSLT